ncbi:MAG: hypothetical protein QOH46_341, partial [Solirubrobacteraceae bacterium]|nr:hypothetical protein [Solirubrobacteraceae bacterium]
MLLAAALASAIIAAPAEARPKLAISMLSNRAELISGGDALVAIDVPRGIRVGKVRVTAGGRDVT